MIDGAFIPRLGGLAPVPAVEAIDACLRKHPALVRYGVERSVIPRVADWLVREIRPTVRTNKRCNAYMLKHAAEHVLRRDWRPAYVGSADLCVAAIIAGYPWRYAGQVESMCFGVRYRDVVDRDGTYRGCR